MHGPRINNPGGCSRANKEKPAAVAGAGSCECRSRLGYTYKERASAISIAGVI